MLAHAMNNGGSLEFFFLGSRDSDQELTIWSSSFEFGRLPYWSVMEKKIIHEEMEIHLGIEEREKVGGRFF